MDSAGATLLRMHSNGNILALGNVVGTYQANTPFRVRKYINIDTKRWSVVIDDEMNGFEDDQLFTDLLYDQNDPNMITYISSLHATLCYYSNVNLTHIVIAFDDIVVTKFVQ